MSQSRLSHKISLCDLIGKLDENECIDVIRTIYHELGFNDLNALLIKIVMTFTETTTTNSLIIIKNTIKQLMTNNESIIECNVNKHDNKSYNVQNSNIVKLPIDLRGPEIDKVTRGG